MSKPSSIKDTLRRLVPLDALSEESLDKLAAKVSMQQLPAGKVLFKRGDMEKVAIYLLSGEVRLVSGDGKVKPVVGGSPEAAHALGHNFPRQSTAMASSDVSFVRVDNELLDILLTWDQSAGYVVEELHPDDDADDDGDWMTRMLRSNVFYRVPPANIQAILTRMESVRAKPGDVIIEQGGEGDYFYIIKSGKAEVLRKAADGRVARLAELKVGDNFGEEALMSSAKRNATVRMSTEGELMRLSKKDFEQLLKEPLLQQVTLEEGRAMVEGGEAVWVDVRLENEYANDHLEGATNVPLYLLRLQYKRLPEDKALIVYCDTGRRSSAATYLLSERGFDVYVLKGGYLSGAETKVA